MNKYVKFFFIILVNIASYYAYTYLYPEKWQSAFDYAWGGYTTAFIYLMIDDDGKKASEKTEV